MARCQCCGSTYREGTVFCIECGFYLPSVVPLGEESTSIRKGSTRGAERCQDNDAPQLARNSRARPCVQVVSSGRQIPLPSGRQVEIGRLDPVHGIFPDVDLTGEDGREGGVSRRHCRICIDQGRLCVEDLGSANGTRLNGERIEPHLRHTLDSGDELQLGRVKLRVLIRD